MEAVKITDKRNKKNEHTKKSYKGIKLLELNTKDSGLAVLVE